VRQKPKPKEKGREKTTSTIPQPTCFRQAGNLPGEKNAVSGRERINRQPSSLPVFQPPSLPALQSSSLPVFQSFSLPVFQSSSLPVFQSSSLPVFQSSSLSVFQSSSLPVFQSFSLPVFQSFSLPVFQPSSLPVFQSSSLSVFQSFSLPIFVDFWGQYIETYSFDFFPHGFNSFRIRPKDFSEFFTKAWLPRCSGITIILIYFITSC